MLSVQIRDNRVSVSVWGCSHRITVYKCTLPIILYTVNKSFLYIVNLQIIPSCFSPFPYSLTSLSKPHTLSLVRSQQMLQLFIRTFFLFAHIIPAKSFRIWSDFWLTSLDKAQSVNGMSVSSQADLEHCRSCGACVEGPATLANIIMLPALTSHCF